MMASALNQEGIMNVSLTPELEKFVADKVKTGLYNNASEVVRASLRLLKEEEDLKAKWREEIEIGWQQARAGQVVDGPAAMRKIQARLEKMKKDQSRKGR
jgi:antitoxin ParD1/3/4